MPDMWEYVFFGGTELLNELKIAFCFDEKLTAQVQAAVSSLLDQTRADGVNCHVYCVCTKEAAGVEAKLQRIVRTEEYKDKLTVVPVDNPYQGAYEVRGISAGTYLRLMLHRLLPEVDRILYMDVDVLVCGSLLPVWQADLGDAVLAAVKGAVNLSDKWEWNSPRPYWKHLEPMRGRYINAGVTLLDLSKIRERNLEEQWKKWAKEKLYYQDQDILNITCRDVIYYLSPRYNRLAYMSEADYAGFVREGIFTEQECEEALASPVIIHYAGDKPWKRYDTNLGDRWWTYVNSRPELKGLFDEAAARRYHGPTILERGLRKLTNIKEERRRLGK